MRTSLGRFEAALLVVVITACSLDRRELLRASDVETGGAGGENGGTDAGGTAGSGTAATGGDGVTGGTSGEAGDGGGGTGGASGGATGGSNSGTGGSDGATGGSNGTGGDSGATSGGGTGGATTGGAGGLSGSAGQGGATAGGGSGGGVSGSGPVTPELEWAQWPMPNPEPGLSYEHDYSVEENDTVVDGVTALMWQRTVSGRLNWAQAKQFCTSPFRLPTAIELISLIDYTRFDPAIDTVAFPGTPAEYFWSSTPGTPTSTDYGMSVDFADGIVAIDFEDSQRRVRCVR